MLQMVLLMGCAPDELGERVQASLARGVDGTDTAIDSGLVTTGGVTWRFVEEGTFGTSSSGPTSLTYIAQAATAPSVLDQLLGTQRVDAEGLWQVAAVDSVLLQDALIREDASSVEIAAGLADPSDVDASRSAVTESTDALVEQPGDVVTWTPNSWTSGSCGNKYYMGDDDRDAVDPTTNSRRRAMVDVRIDNGNKTVCSGVILRRQWVLTGAHCLYDDNHDVRDAEEIQVSRRDGVDSTPDHGVLRYYIGPGFTSTGTDPKDDYALLALTQPLDLPFDDMDISSASDATIQSLTNPLNLAFPHFAPDCSSNLNVLVADDLYLNSAGGLGSVFNAKVNILMDGGPGHSGSPIFYCPAGDPNVCEGDEVGYVLAVWSGWNGFETTMVGPKAPAFRDWATLIMDFGI